VLPELLLVIKMSHLGLQHFLDFLGETASNYSFIFCDSAMEKHAITLKCTLLDLTGLSAVEFGKLAMMNN